MHELTRPPTAWRTPNKRPRLLTTAAPCKTYFLIRQVNWRSFASVSTALKYLRKEISARDCASCQLRALQTRSISSAATKCYCHLLCCNSCVRPFDLPYATIHDWRPYRAAAFELTFPLIFELSLPNFQRLYCGVLEFIAAEDTLVLPNWVSVFLPVRRSMI